MVDLDLLKEENGLWSLTEQGLKVKELLLNDPVLYFEYLHYITISSAFDERKPKYFLTYYLITKISL